MELQTSQLCPYRQKFQRPECEYQATVKGNIIIHQKSIPEGQKFQCPECEDEAVIWAAGQNKRKHEKNGQSGILTCTSTD